MTPVQQTVFVDENSSVGNCMSACLASILDIPLSEVIDTANPEIRANGFWTAIHDWLGDKGLRMRQVSPHDVFLNGRYSIATGPSPRGNFHHAVIYFGNQLNFDPHPSNAGLVRVITHYVIEK